MRTILAVGSLVLLGGSARAADLVYETIDTYTSRSSASAVITGVVQGDSAATTRTILYNSVSGVGDSSDLARRCDALATVMLTRPGKYLFTITIPSSNDVTACALT